MEIKDLQLGDRIKITRPKYGLEISGTIDEITKKTNGDNVIVEVRFAGWGYTAQRINNFEVELLSSSLEVF